MFNIQDRIKELETLKNHQNDRVLVLKVIDGKKPKSSTGIIDPRLFSGENNLHAIKDKQLSLWALTYDSGILPPALQQRFTSFNALFKYAKEYLGNRNIEIKEVVG